MPVATASFLSSRAARPRRPARALRTIFRRGARGRRDRARHRVADDAGRLHDARDRGTDFTDNRSDGADASVRLVGRGAWGWSALAYVQTRQFASRYASVNAARTAATLTLDQYNVPATGLGGRVGGVAAARRRHHVAAGRRYFATPAGGRRSAIPMSRGSPPAARGGRRDADHGPVRRRQCRGGRADHHRRCPPWMTGASATDGWTRACWRPARC